jgi:hypothetical protein
MEQSGSGIYEKTQMDLVENWFKELVAANDRLLEEANQLVYTACDGAEVTPNEKIRRLELLTACVRHNARLAARGEKLRAEVFKDVPELLEKYQAYIALCEKQLLEMPKAGF